MPPASPTPLRNAGFLMPIIPGKADQLRAFFRELLDREDEFGRLCGALEVTREIAWIAKDPEGREFVLIYLQCPDPERMSREFGEMKDDFAMWEKSTMEAITGLPHVQQVEREFVPAELIFDWTSEVGS